MADTLNNVGVVILAAGKGKRMNATSQQPKVLMPLAGRPMISYLLDAIEKSLPQIKPVVVIAPDLQIIARNLGPRCQYVVQEEQRGTGHAVQTAQASLRDYKHVLVLYGDHPFVSAECISKIISRHLQDEAALTLTTVKVLDFDEWRAGFSHFGRIVRDDNGQIQRIVEHKDATDDEKQITEVNPSYFCFNAQWLWGHLPLLDCHNAQNEYYLTDLVELALKRDDKLTSLILDNPHEALGINTLEQLALAESIVTSHYYNPSVSFQITAQLAGKREED